LETFLARIAITVAENNIPKELVINFDETGLHLTPSGNRSFVTVGTTQIKKVGYGMFLYFKFIIIF
jgi:hypothetical protein